ncbi:MAG: zinc-binding dehydrogenase [Bacteroidota bacterium]|nr:zinc-binding dehydrogenase [Bacteroidota bacterium]
MNICPVEQAACFAINPLTAYGLYESARLNKSRAIIQNAAGSQVCNYIRKMAAMSDMEVIDVVRKKETLAKLKASGSKHVLLSEEEDFGGKLRDLAHLLNATTAFDAVGGEMSGSLYNAMPASSKVIVYGGLSGKAIGNIDVLHVIFKNKSLGGFNLNDWLATKTEEHFRQIAEEVQDMFIRQELKTEIQASYKFEAIKEGLKQYLGNMSGGKILLTP